MGDPDGASWRGLADTRSGYPGSESTWDLSAWSYLSASSFPSAFQIKLVYKNSWEIGIRIFKRRIYLFERQSNTYTERDRDRHTEILLSSGSWPKCLRQPGQDWAGLKQKPGMPSGLSPGWRGPK